jgi:hypothetical protein
MPSLLELQSAIAHGIVSGSDEVFASIAPHVLADGITAEARFEIYRNTFLAGLINALRLSYPAVERLVGKDFFAQAAEIFIRDAPPKSAYLNDYGAGFPAFLAQFAPGASLPYLSDVARLEWAVNTALHAEEMEPLALERLANIAEPERLRLKPHPALTFLRLELPGDAIWRAVLEEDGAALQRIAFGDGPVHLLVHYGHAVEVRRMAIPEWHFARALALGQTLGAAMADAHGLDASAALAGHFAAGHFIDFACEPPASEKTT